MLVNCSKCGKSYGIGERRWKCDCGGYLRLAQTGIFTKAALSTRRPDLWRYREALGVSPAADPVTLGEGFTPLVRSSVGGRELWLKLDYLCPTGSYKDRGSTIMMTQLRSWGVPQIIEDSSGNAGASVAAYAALAGIQCEIYVPASTSAGKIAQILAYGANLVKVPGSREDTADAAWEAAQHTFYASHNWNPWFVAGMKTVAYEIAEQLEWNPPDWVVVPVGGGSLLVGVCAGFQDLLRAGLINRMPRILGVQATACPPVFRAWQAGAPDVKAVDKSPTAAEGISVARPVRGPDVLEAVRQSGGAVTTVDDEEIWSTLEALGAVGVYVEPTSAAAPAAAVRQNGSDLIASTDRVVVVLTGSGLKATDKIVERLFPADASRERGQLATK
ncbi:MAG: threonine synthase [Terriglobales bacterium]